MLSKNAVTIDLEDWYQGIEQPYDSWSRFDERIDIGTDIVLSILDETNTRATFFVLGWLADQRPDLIRRVADEGHEIASHGYDHEKLYDTTPEALREALGRAKKVTEDVIGKAVPGHRAPFFSLTRRSLWAIDLIAELGFEYDASIYPGENWRYGIPNTPEDLYELGDTGVIEFPASLFPVWNGRRVGIGGAYFRILPYFLTHRAVQERTAAGKITNFYLHPWEFDPWHPLARFRWKAMLTHYFNLFSTAPRFRKLMQQNEFRPMGEIIADVKREQLTIPRLDLREGEMSV